jgi:DNA invertase Pin-like site-specific DNA recombinase
MRVKYVRWSSIGQNADRQLLNENYFDKIYQEQVSGSLHFEKRMEGGRLLADIKAGKVRELYVEEISRIGRDSLDCMRTLKVCEENKVNVVIENMAISSLVDGKVNPVFKIITGILSTMAENEKQNILERTEMGKIAARNRGVKFGRKEGSKENYSVFMSKATTKLIVKYLTDGNNRSVREVAKLTDSSTKTVQKVKNYLKYEKPMMPKKRKIKSETKELKQLVMDLGKETPIKEKEISAEDKWKLEALEAQLAWIKDNVIPIPTKKNKGI